MSLQLIANYRKPHKDILQNPDPVLKKVSKKVIAIDKHVLHIANKLINTLKELDKPMLPWLGMSSPQLGYNLRVIVIKKNYHDYQIMINPEIIKQKWFLPAISGCYSLKGFYLIKSPYWSKVKFMDLDEKIQTETFIGGTAVLLKQEIDHINGRLISD